MNTLTLATLLALLAVAPTAAADETVLCTPAADRVGGACAEERLHGNTTDATCAQEDTYRSGSDSVSVWAPDGLAAAGVAGWRQCNHPAPGGFGIGKSHGHGFSVGVFAPAAAVAAGWSESTTEDSEGNAFHECHVFAVVFVAGAGGGPITSCEGVLAPPEPAWGELLP